MVSSPPQHFGQIAKHWIGPRQFDHLCKTSHKAIEVFISVDNDPERIQKISTVLLGNLGCR